MISAYPILKALAEDIRDNVALKNKIVSLYENGLQIQIDDNVKAPISSEKAPFLVLFRIPSSDFGIVMEADVIMILVVVGVMPCLEDTDFGIPYTEFSERDWTGNGLAQWYNPEKAEEILVDVVNIIKNHDFGTANFTVWEVTTDIDGGSHYPLQTGSAVIQIKKQRTLSDI